MANGFKDIGKGSAWKKVTKDGREYLQGNFKLNTEELAYPGEVKIGIALFPNDNKKKDTSPDYSIFLSIKSEQEG